MGSASRKIAPTVSSTGLVEGPPSWSTRPDSPERALGDAADDVADVLGVEAAVDELLGKGITFEQYDLPGFKTDERGIAETQGVRGAWFKDPDGNILAVAERT